MSPRKGGIGRNPDRKMSCKQKQASSTSLTAEKKHLMRMEKEDSEKILGRKERREKSNASHDVPIMSSNNNLKESKIKLEICSKELGSAERKVKGRQVKAHDLNVQTCLLTNEKNYVLHSCDIKVNEMNNEIRAIKKECRKKITLVQKESHERVNRMRSTTNFTTKNVKEKGDKAMIIAREMKKNYLPG